MDDFLVSTPQGMISFNLSFPWPKEVRAVVSSQYHALLDVGLCVLGRVGSGGERGRGERGEKSGGSEGMGC